MYCSCGQGAWGSNITELPGCVSHSKTSRPILMKLFNFSCLSHQEEGEDIPVVVKIQTPHSCLIPFGNLVHFDPQMVGSSHLTQIFNIDEFFYETISTSKECQVLIVWSMSSNLYIPLKFSLKMICLPKDLLFIHLYSWLHWVAKIPSELSKLHCVLHTKH